MAPDADSRPHPRHRRPRWVTVAVAVAVVVLLVLVGLLLVGGQHGPGRHLSSAGAAGIASAVLAGGPSSGAVVG